MDAIKKILFSTRTMGVLMLIFIISIGTATFIESADSTEAAKIRVYNAWWFELMLAWLSINLLVNTFTYRMWRKEKLAILVFHLAFIVIIIGAAISRYTGQEGIIRVGENSWVNYMYSSEPYLNVTAINEDGTNTSVEMQRWFAATTPAHNEFEFDFPVRNGKPLKFQYEAFIPNSIDTIKRVDKGGMEILELVVAGQTHYLPSGGIINPEGDYLVSFNNNSKTQAIQITSNRGKLSVRAPYEGYYRDMTSLRKEDRMNPSAVTMDTLVRDTEHPFNLSALYRFDGLQLVMRNYHDGVLMSLTGSEKKDAGIDALVMNAVTADETRQIILRGGKSNTGANVPFIINGQQFSASYGSKIIELPFEVGLKDFRFEKYAGTTSPSSYESDLVVNDTVNGVTREQTVIMNHVMDYEGYRLFQSSYDSSQPGIEPDITVLSVNKDVMGTIVTYIGYLLMTIGFIFTLFSRKSRFREVAKSLSKEWKKGVGIVALIVGLSSLSAAQDADYKPIHPEHAEQVGKICVLGKGRIKPVHTLATEILRKLYKSDHYKDQGPVQVFLGMTFKPAHWMEIPMISVRNPDLREKIGISGKYAAFTDIYQFNETSEYTKLDTDYDEAFKTPESLRSSYQKEVIKTYDKLMMMRAIFTRQWLKIFPIADHPEGEWSSGSEPGLASIKTGMGAGDSLTPLQLLVGYETVLNQGWDSGDWSAANRFVQQVDEYQRKIKGNDPDMPSATKVNLEISYNKLHLLDRLYTWLMLLGLFIYVLAIVFSVRTKKAVKGEKWVHRIAVTLLTILLLCQAYALGMRWYISGHAPWSNGYEALAFIAFMTVLAGTLFSRRYMLVAGAAGMLGGILLMTAHHSNYDPDISNLVPVLKSYWLMIHVAVITGSYGFLGIGSLLGFTTLLLRFFKGRRNIKKVEHHISGITYISELTITIGLIMAAVGTFLGGVWANESWGRYWGWDPKETWALVIVLAYGVLLHFRFIPGLRGKTTFNVASMWMYSTVIMTFFGVNYYLSGLHSYAEGDAPPFPLWATILIIFLVIFSVLAIIRDMQTKKYLKQ